MSRGSIPTAVVDHLDDCLPAQECVVASGPRPVIDQRVLSAVTPRTGFDFDKSRPALLAAEIPDYAIPESFVVCDELPHNAAGKVARNGVRTVVLDALDLSDAPPGAGTGEPHPPTAILTEAPQ